MEALIILIAIIAGVFIGIRWAIGFVRRVTAKTGYGFLSIPFWLLFVSLLVSIYVGFTVQEDYWIGVVVFGATITAGIININRLGFGNGTIFTLLQCIAIYCWFVVLMLYAFFKNAKDLGPKFED